MNDDRHWYRGDTFNGQPMDPRIGTLCGKVGVPGACHTYFITCAECQAEMDKLSPPRTPEQLVEYMKDPWKGDNWKTKIERPKSLWQRLLGAIGIG